MASRKRDAIRAGALVIAVVGLAGMSVWVFQNRVRLVAACLHTVNGISSKLAHLNEPFGIGTAVESRNPVLGVIPEFSLTERSGRSIGRSDLLGGYWVASFIFTRCATTCPMVTAELASLQSRLPQDVRLVSFSVDPEHDSPQVLATYANKFGADVDRWLFLTGDQEAIYRLAREGFHLAVEENNDAPAGFEVTHTPRLALVDPKGRIRGYYESSDETDLNRLCADIDRLSHRVREETTTRSHRADGTSGTGSSLTP